MIAKKQKPPPSQRRFPHAWTELVYLCRKIHYWLHVRGSRPRANRYQTRIEQVLDELPQDGMAIIRQEALALLNELKGDLSKSIFHRAKEIELTERLHQLAEAPTCDAKTRAYMLQYRDTEALQARRVILQELLKKKRDVSNNGARKAH